MHVRKIEVEKNDVVIVQLAEIEALFPEIGRVDVEALRPEHQLDALRGRRLVLDQQHAHRVFPHSRPEALPALNGPEALINHSRSEGKRLIFSNSLDSLPCCKRVTETSTALALWGASLRGQEGVEERLCERHCEVASLPPRTACEP